MTDLELRLLSVLIEKGRSHGLQIGRAAEDRFDKLVGAGSLYRALHRMEKQGWLTAAWEPEEERSGHQGPPRRYYAMNGAGAKALEAHLTSTARTVGLARLARRPA